MAKYLIHQAQEEMIHPKDLINLIQTTIVEKLYKKNYKGDSRNVRFK
ncbi:MAG: hypothetical protein MGU50_22980 [Trichodesmium sp. MAG_R02]|nr:hypothetical protein [Trichodesmium sp. MAG_R02]